MKTVKELYAGVRDISPALSKAAQQLFSERWQSFLATDLLPMWFECLAEALNTEMENEVPFETHRAFLEFMERSFHQGSEEVRRCIDTSFVENLFFQVASVKCEPYWRALSPTFKQLYLAFYRIDP